MSIATVLNPRKAVSVMTSWKSVMRKVWIATVMNPRETVSVLTFWKSVMRKVCEAAGYASRSSGFSNSAILVLLLYAVALYGFLTSNDWTDPDEFARVMIIACVSPSE